MITRLRRRFVAKPAWGVENLGPWFPSRARNSGGEQRIGEVWFEDPDSPLLVKFLFTSAKLSVQVHPGDAYARKHHNSRGKTEMWHILRAEPGAQIAAGFRKPVSERRLRSSAVSGEIEKLLAWHDAAAGDTFFIPAGTVHAIGGGLVLCEIQQRSDITYRLYDYNRGRELHLDHGVEVARRTPYNPRRRPRGETLVECRYFKTSRKEVQGVLELPGDEREQIAVVIRGTGRIEAQRTRAGDAWRIESGVRARLEGEVSVLVVAAGGATQ